MPVQPFETHVRHEPGAAVIDMNGEINGAADDVLNTAYTEAAGQDSADIVLNFCNVDYINSTGIALIVGLLAQARSAHRRLLVYGLSNHYLEIFQITRLADFMDIYPDETAALQGAGDSPANERG